jgi:L-asparaginase
MTQGDPEMHIKIFTTGGTIDKVYFDQKSQYEVGISKVGEILKEANVTLEFSIEALMQKDSLEMTDADRLLIAHRVAADSHGHVLITHGTDTMADTARALSGIPGKVMVLTGAMMPANFKVTDAVFNVGFAVACVQILAPGVYIAMNGHIFDPARVQKNRALKRFESV